MLRYHLNILDWRTVIEIRKRVPSSPLFSTLLLLTALVLPGTLRGGEKNLPSLDLSHPGGASVQAVSTVPGKPGAMKGNVPAGWRDDSSWAKVVGSYRLNEFEGVRFLEVRMERIEQGSIQLVSPFPEDATGKTYELTLTARGVRPVSFEVLIVQSDAPYRTYWTREVRVGTRFEEQVLEIPALPAMEKPQLMLRFSSPGGVDLRALSIAAPSGDTTEDEPARNLLKVSRFPLGPPAGMSLNRDVSHDVATFDADPLTYGPSGVPALHAVPEKDKTLEFDSGLIEYRQRNKPHMASVWIRGDGRLVLSAMAVKDGSVRVVKERLFRIRPQHGWQRAELEFVPPGDSANQFLRFQVQGEMWIDAAMVTLGKETLEFAGQGIAEVALGLPDSPAALAGIQFADDPAHVRWAASGAITGTTLKGIVTTATGATADLDPVPLSEKYLQFGKLDFAKIAAEPLGTFRVEAAIYDSTGKQISPFAEIVILRTQQPRFWGQDAPQSAFGQHVRPNTRHVLMAKALGNNWARLHNDGGHITDWRYLEPEPGQWKWADADIDRYRKQHLTVLGQVSTAPKWASYLNDTGIDGDGGYFGKYFLPKDLKQFANYARTLAEHYRGKIAAYEIWNEPWQVRWFGQRYVEVDGTLRIESPDNPQERYVELSRVAFDTLRAVDPAITVVGLNSTTTRESRQGPDGVTDGTSWTAGFLKAGGLKFLDVVSFHEYTADANGFPEDAVSRGVQVALGPNEKFQRILTPAWMTEGASTVGGRVRFGFYKHSLPYRNTEDIPALAESVLRYDVSMLANGVEKIFLYSMGDYIQGTPGSFRSAVTMDGAAHPSALGRASLAWHVDGLNFVELTEIADGVFAYFFEGDGRAVAVLCPRSPSDSFSLPEAPDLSYTDLWLNPVAAGKKLDGATHFASTSGNVPKLKSLLNPR